jgi:hypothetical protein
VNIFSVSLSAACLSNGHPAMKKDPHAVFWALLFSSGLGSKSAIANAKQVE